MKIITAEDSESIHCATEILRSGGVVAHATETCYGLACDLTNQNAVEKLFRIKNRPTDQPVSALFSSLDAVMGWCQFSARALEIAKKHLPGPLTIIVPDKEGKKLFLTADGNPALEIGVRISPHAFASGLSKAFGSPIATTSANVHGENNPYSVQDILAQFENREHRPDLVIDSGALKKTAPSTVVRVIGEDVAVLRKGDVDCFETE